MFRIHNSKKLTKIRSRHQKLKTRRTTRPSSLSHHFQDVLTDLPRSKLQFISYTFKKLESICQQKMSSITMTTSDSCPFICLFCQNLIYEPLTLYCGHTFCDYCIKNEQLSSTNSCPRCSRDLQEQIQSSIIYAREKDYRINRFLKQLFDRSETLKTNRQTILLVHQGQTEYSKGNYQQAIDIYSQIIDQDKNDHYALYNRAKAYTALKQYDQSLTDAVDVIKLKPRWSKGYLCQSEISFEMKNFADALRSSLKALVIDPEDQISKQTMARHLHAVLHDDQDDGNETISTIEAELEQFKVTSSTMDKNIDTMTSVTDDMPLTLCKSTHSSTACFCLEFDYKPLNVRDFECSVCINLLWLPVTTPCGHVFCRECLIRSVDNTQTQCPICKSSLDEFFPMLIQSNVKTTEIISRLIETYFSREYNERKQAIEQEISRGVSISQSLTNNPESTIFEVPIFVCVLALPHCSCPLHVYEPRYRLMMRRTNESESRTFGMCTYDEQTETFVDYGTLLYIRGLMYLPDGRSVVDTIGQRRFRVIERGMKDGYCTAKVELIQDHQIEQHEFDDLFQLNRDTYNRVRQWFNQLDILRKALIIQQLEEYPSCDDLTQNSADGPNWTWIMLNLLPIQTLLQYTALASQSFRIRLQMINDTIDFLLNQGQTQTIDLSNNEQSI